MNGFVSRVWLLVPVAALFVAGTSEAFAQVAHVTVNPYHLTYHPQLGYVPVPVGGYGGYGYYGAITPGMGAGFALAGYGQAAAGVGQARVSTAQAQVIHQQAVGSYLQNVGVAEDTLLDVTAKRAQAAQQHREELSAHTQEQIAAYQKSLEQMSAAHRLTADQFDAERGVLNWPYVLRSSQYTDLRLKVDRLFHERTPQDSGENSSGYDAIQQACKEMQAIVKEELKKGMPINDYVTATHFISSVAYEARFSVKESRSTAGAARVQTGQRRAL